MLEHELKVVLSLARTAGAAMMRHYKTDLNVREKFADDNFAEPVTEADHASNDIIMAGLLSAFPDDGFLSEETPDTKTRLSKDRVWIIDPLDGTKGFINQDGDFAVQIGLAIGGQAALGIVYLPFEDILYYAVTGEGCWMEQKDREKTRLQVSAKTGLSDMNLAVSRNHPSPKMHSLVEALGLKGETQRGSVGLKIGLIAQRICDMYLHLSPRTKFWDTCAPQIILEEAGGVLTDLFGYPLSYDIPDVRNLNGVVATNGIVHGQVIEKLKPMLNQFGRVRIKSVS